jgi:WD40 repeat protein
VASLVAVFRGVFLYGDSGTGKSSLVNAGLFPEAVRRGYEPVRLRVQPRTGEELVVEPVAVAEDGRDVLPSVLTPDADGAGQVVLSIAEFERRVRGSSAEHRTLVVFDQFEEILTLFDAAADARTAIADMIARLLREPLPVKLLFAFREEYLGRVKQLLSARPELVDQALRLGPPSADALEAIIRGPFERFPGHFERKLDATLAHRLIVALAERFGNGEVSLSEVQTVCLRLWRSPDPAALLADKGVQGLLEDDLGEALDAFAPAQRAAAVALLSELVTAAGTRNVISAEDLRQRVREEDPEVDVALLDETLERLERDSRLVRRERRRDLYLYEITSEFLVPWISARREEQRHARERQRERRRRLRVLATIALGVGMLASIVIAVLAVWALVQRSNARSEASEARSLALAASSFEPLRTRPDVSLALAFEAYRERPRPEAASAVVRALLAARRSALRGALDDAIADVAFSPDGRLLATPGSRGVIRLWDPATQRQVRRLAGPDAPGQPHVAFSPDGGILASARSHTISLWNPATGARLASLRTVGGGAITGLAFRRDGRTLAVCGLDAPIRFWDVRSLRQLAPLPTNARGDNDIEFRPGDRVLAAGGADGTTRLFDVASRTPIGRLRARGPVLGLAFRPDGRTLAVADFAGIRLWDAHTRRPIGVLSGHRGRVFEVAFSPDGKVLASSGEDRTVRLWDPVKREPLGQLTGHTSLVTSVAFSPGGHLLASASFDGKARLWNPAARPLLGRITGHMRAVRAVAFSRDGKTIASADSAGAILLRSAATRTTLHKLAGHAGAVNALAFDRRGRFLASAGSDRTIRIWNASDGRLLRRLTGRVAFRGVAFSPGGDRLAASGDDGVRLWTVPGFRQIRAALREAVAVTIEPGRLIRHAIDYAVRAVAFGPDGRTLAAAGSDGAIELLDPRTLRATRRLVGHTGRVAAVAFSPDGRVLASAGEDGTVRLWDPRSGAAAGVLTGHSGPVTAVSFSPDGRSLASASADKTVRLWDVATRAPVGRLTGHEAAVQAVAFSPVGLALASGSADHTVRLWNDLLWDSLETLRRKVCAVVPTSLSQVEWTQYAPGIPYRRSCG